jgi:DNA-binding transcriptional LysR family regulator
MEFQSYHAIVACVAAGSGVAIVPRLVIGVIPGGKEVTVTPFPKEISRARTQLVWRPDYHSVALEALKKLLTTQPVKMAA